MYKKELAYNYILTEAIEGKRYTFTQLEISKRFRISLSTVNNALAPLVSIGAIEKKARSFVLADMKKMLYYWATTRKFERDIVYKTRIELPVSKIERLVPSSAVFTAYSAYRCIFHDVPADYSEVYFYIPENELDEIKKRFQQKKGPPNVFALVGFWKNVVSKPLLFTDLWNIKTWYAREFLHALEKRLKL
ncbi:MAG: hypothetical protein AB1391_04465 [Candidatus Micrarchaeota archaeon]